MTRFAPHLPSLLLLLSLALPSAGPLIDHHFGERQPVHKHLVSVSYHTHAPDNRHIHSRGAGSSDPFADVQPVVVYNFDGGSAASALVLNDDTAARSIIDHEPSSIFILPLPATASMTGRSPAPPDEPPRAIL